MNLTTRHTWIWFYLWRLYHRQTDIVLWNLLHRFPTHPGNTSISHIPVNQVRAMSRKLWADVKLGTVRRFWRVIGWKVYFILPRWFGNIFTTLGTTSTWSTIFYTRNALRLCTCRPWNIVVSTGTTLWSTGRTACWTAGATTCRSACSAALRSTGGRTTVGAARRATGGARTRHFFTSLGLFILQAWITAVNKVMLQSWSSLLLGLWCTCG